MESNLVYPLEGSDKTQAKVNDAIPHTPYRITDEYAKRIPYPHTRMRSVVRLSSCLWKTVRFSNKDVRKTLSICPQTPTRKYLQCKGRNFFRYYNGKIQKIVAFFATAEPVRRAALRVSIKKSRTWNDAKKCRIFTRFSLRGAQ